MHSLNRALMALFDEAESHYGPMERSRQEQEEMLAEVRAHLDGLEPAATEQEQMTRWIVGQLCGVIEGLVAEVRSMTFIQQKLAKLIRDGGGLAALLPDKSKPSKN